MGQGGSGRFKAGQGGSGWVSTCWIDQNGSEWVRMGKNKSGHIRTGIKIMKYLK